MLARNRSWTVLSALLACACATPVDTGDTGGIDTGGIDTGGLDVGPRSDGAPRIDTNGDADCDHDHDGHLSIACGGDDCDDNDANRFPGNPEVCDTMGHDEDCNPLTFGTTDADGDHYISTVCFNTDAMGVRHGGDDCDDSNSSVHPTAPEVCNGLDDDCDGAIDEGVLRTFHRDADGDGFGCTCADTMTGCNPPAGYVESSSDCDDMDMRFHPGAPGTCGICPNPSFGPEVCNGLDDDCDVLIDESATCPVANGTAACTSGACILTACNTGYHACGTACADSASVMTCGTNCMPCAPAPANATSTCRGSCGFACNPGWAILGAGCDVAPPRPIAPLSTASVTSRRPTLRWMLASGTDGAHIDMCRDRACTMLVTSLDATGTSVAPAADLPTGVLFWRLRSRTGGTTSVLAGPTWQFVVGVRSAPVDTSWGTTLDVNGDGYADLVVGADGVTSFTGRAYLYLGSAAGLAATPATTLTGPDGAAGHFGESVASAGDVNGDGYADLAVGAQGASTYSGRAYIYVGSASGLSASPTTTLTGPDGANGQFGISVAGAGDVNGDGYADLAVGARSAPWSSTAAGNGRTYVYLGSASGLAPSPTTTLTGPDGAGGFFGQSVASAGDVNGDGYADLAVGAWCATYVGGICGGRAYVYLGSATGIAASPATTLTDGVARSDFGLRVASAGDVNGDGYADLAVGADNASSAAGQAYVYLGSAAGLAATPATTLTGSDGAGGGFGVSVATAGDINGDGYVDLAVGASAVSSSTGRAYLYLGSAAGVSASPAVTLAGPDGANGSFGWSVASAGDVNGDRYADLAVGAYGASSGVGRAYVYVGSAAGLGTTPATTVTGPDGAPGYFGTSVY